MVRGGKPAKSKEAKPPITRTSPKDGAARVSDLEKRLAEAREQQTATSEILGVISRSPSNVAPVFATIARNAMHLLGGTTGGVFLVTGDRVHFGAAATRETVGPLASLTFPMSLSEFSRHRPVLAQVLETRAPASVADMETDPRTTAEARDFARTVGFRSNAIVPMLRNDELIGLIVVARAEPRATTDDEMALLKTFADQAVIAIENARLFTELQEKNQALTEAHAQVSESLEQQTATGEILRVISQAHSDLRPVFDAIRSAADRLCDGDPDRGGVFLVTDGLIAPAHTPPASAADHLSRNYPRPVDTTTLIGRSIIERRVVNVPDVVSPDVLGLRVRGAPIIRSQLTVPILLAGEPIGVLVVAHRDPIAFTDAQVKLLQTFADQPVIAIENVRLFKELQTSNRELTTALDKQTATSDILGVISRSQTDVQPVFDAILSSAIRLLGAYSGTLTRIAGEQIEIAAITSTSDVGDAALRARFPQPLTSAGPHARTIRDRAPLNIADAHTDPRLPEGFHAYARVRGYRSQVAVPLLHHDEAIGTISVTRGEPGGFTVDEIALLQTFADQAVIAIENVRLFKELQTRNSELTEALEQQTATSDVLRVISQSQTDLQPVFDALIDSATKLCVADMGAISRFDGEVLRLVLHSGMSAEVRAFWDQRIIPLGRGYVTGRAALERRTIHAPDILADPSYDYTSASSPLREGQSIAGYRATLVAPMVRDGALLGTIAMMRREPRPFTPSQIKLLETFADQAVIAIENVRLFNETKEALERQTATSEILRVISSSPTDAQPVFDTIVEIAARLCEGLFGTLFSFDGELIHVVAARNWTATAFDVSHRVFPAHPSRALFTGRAILDRAVVHVPDVELDREHEHHAMIHAVGFRSYLAVPMLRDGVPLGVIAVGRAEPGPFSDNQIALLQTFADQAVIAIENVRLFKELEARTAALTRSVEQLTALGEVGRAVSSTLDLGTVLTTIVSRAVQLSRLDGGVVFEYDEDDQEFVQRAEAETGGALAAARRSTRIQKGEGVVGRTAITLEPVQVFNITAPGAYVGPNRENLIESGVRAILAVPMVREGQLIGCLGVTRNQPGEFPTETIELLRTFATQSALAIQNARLFQEIADKSHQLEAASQHKSEFLANMSHELRTPLNAIIGFSEVLSERMFGELNEKQEEYLKDIYASGNHLLSLINDILDLSKIEAGRMELELTDFDLPQAIDNALILVRERAARRVIALEHSVDERLGEIRGDERKVKQVLLNLLSNALKFTPEGGRVEVRAGMVDGIAEIAVTDTGVGIAPEDQGAIFEEFRQVGTADKKAEGTGLGLTLCRKFVELHGGRIWVKSEVGVGSTFTFSIPVNRRE